MARTGVSAGADRLKGARLESVKPHGNNYLRPEGPVNGHRITTQVKGSGNQPRAS